MKLFSRPFRWKKYLPTPPLNERKREELITRDKSVTKGEQDFFPFSYSRMRERRNNRTERGKNEDKSKDKLVV